MIDAPQPARTNAATPVPVSSGTGAARRRGILAALAILVTMISGCLAGPSGRPQPGMSFDVTWDGRLVVFTGPGKAGSALYILNRPARRVRRVTPDAQFAVYPSFSPDWRRLVYAYSSAEGDPQHIGACDLNGQHWAQITSQPSVFDAWPSYSPDGRQVAFARAALRRPYSMGGYTWDEWDVYTTPARGGAVRRITAQEFAEISAPRWSADGRTIVFSARLPGPLSTNVYAVDRLGRAAPRRLTTDGHSRQPTTSRAGDSIAFISDAAHAFSYEICTIGLDGSHRRQLTRRGRYAIQPRFTDDGAGIAFLADTTPERSGARWELFKVPTRGGAISTLAGSALLGDPEGWRPR